MKKDLRIGVIGRGKTGGAVIDVLRGQASQSAVSEPLMVFSRENPIVLEKTKNLDALIVFVPAEGFKEILPQLLECQIPVVCGTTGFTWPEDFDAELRKRRLTWIVGSNFSPGMNFLFAVANLAQKNRQFLGDPNFSIHEIHHVHKKDSPSGTALSLKKLTGGETEIQAERIGDHPGFHELVIFSKLESLSFCHDAKDRRAFAEGAVYAAQNLLPGLSPGLYSFEKLMNQKIFENAKEENQ